MTREVAALRLCLVTDRDLSLGRSLPDVVGRAVAGGVTMVQLREKTADTREFLSQALQLKRLLAGTGIPLIVNDRVDIALAADAEGVHVGQSDMPVEHVRRLVGPAKWIGLSISNAAQLRNADVELADYLGIGPIHRQATKLDASEPLGIDGFGRMRQQTLKPVVAIGGVKPADAHALFQRGADGLAVVSGIMSADDPESAARAFLAYASA